MLDVRGIPTRECPMCGCDIFRVGVVFDDEYEVSAYFLDAECSECGTLLTAPTPLDLMIE